MKRTTVAIILCALLGVAGACGSSKKDTTATEGAAASAEKPSETTVSTAPSGSTGSSTTSTTAASTTTTAAAVAPAGGSTDEAFAAQGNALCKKFNDQVAAVPQPTATTPAALGAYLDQAVALLDQQIAELRALTPPASASAAWAKVLQTIDAERAQIQAVIPRLKAGDATAINEMQAISSDDINSQFDALGMTTCGSSPRWRGSRRSR